MSRPKSEYDRNFVKSEASLSRFAFCGTTNGSEHHEKTFLMEPYGGGDYEEYTTLINNNDKDEGKRYAGVTRTRRHRTKPLDAQEDDKKQEIRKNQDKGRYAKPSSRQNGEEQNISEELYYYDLELRTDALSISDISMTDDDDHSTQLQCNEATPVVETQALESEHQYRSSSAKSSSRRQESPSLDTNTRIRRRDDQNKQGTHEHSYFENKAKIPIDDRTESRAAAELLRDGLFAPPASENLPPFQRSFSDYPTSTWPRLVCYRRTQSERNWQHHRHHHHADLHKQQGMRYDRGQRHNDPVGLSTTPAAAVQHLVTNPSPIDTYLASPEWTELQCIKKDWRDFLKQNRAKSLVVPTAIDTALVLLGSVAHEEFVSGDERAS
jgi:hypothetical protein